MNTPMDIVRYIVENELEYKFLSNMQCHKGGYSIAEILDKEFKNKDGKYSLVSKNYNVDVEITDDDVMTALINGLYVTPFISRHGDNYQIHFFVHKYPVSMKEKYDEQILTEIIQYMILKTVIALRLDTEQKVQDYLK